MLEFLGASQVPSGFCPFTATVAHCMTNTLFNCYHSSYLVIVYASGQGLSRTTWTCWPRWEPVTRD